MMPDMMSVMKDDMLRQFEEYFAAPEPEAHSGDVEAIDINTHPRWRRPSTVTYRIQTVSE
jgi:hypothetical protein